MGWRVILQMKRLDRVRAAVLLPTCNRAMFVTEFFRQH